MNGTQYKTALARLGMTQGEAAAFFKVTLKTSNVYANGGKIPEAVAKLLRLMVKLDLNQGTVKVLTQIRYHN